MRPVDILDELVFTHHDNIVFELFILRGRVDRRNEIVSGGEFKQTPGSERTHLFKYRWEVLVCCSDILVSVQAVLQEAVEMFGLVHGITRAVKESKDFESFSFDEALLTSKHVRAQQSI